MKYYVLNINQKNSLSNFYNNGCKLNFIKIENDRYLLPTSLSENSCYSSIKDFLNELEIIQHKIEEPKEEIL
jgi:hypothetical protein